MSRRVIIVGVQGVGKTTVVEEAVSILKKKGVKVKVAVFGTVMMEEARKLGLYHRDDLRRLPIPTQRQLQLHAAKAIAKVKAELLFVDTHAYIPTAEGLWPGLPADVLSTLKPANLFLIEAEPDEILGRRKRDASRQRDMLTRDDVERDMQLTRSSLAAASTLTGATILVVKNREGAAAEAASRIVAALE